MATKKTTTTAKKTAKKAAKKAAKKTTKKVATKKATKKVTKKAAAKVANKATKVAPELNLNTKIGATIEEIQQAAYLNYLERIQSDLPGSAELDWAKAEQDLA
ncbi:MAG: hypothetical protein ABGY95_08535 [Rubritalea sp.]|uniref:hypothetical protein n=1 Tax=Rubritalea sp. TaxID=2109375 RepID=UPI003242220F